MEIIIGKTAGFCYGVDRAVTNARKCIENNKKVYCLGEIVHNKQVVEELRQKGLKFINNINEIKVKEMNKNTTVIIRAHGEPKSTYKDLEKSEILDLTCPNVEVIHKIVEEYTNKDFYILIIGQKEHPEVIGTYGFTNDCSIIENEEDINLTVKKLRDKKINKILIVVQTTFSLEKFERYVSILKEQLNNKNSILEIRNTICNATKLRQEETEKIAKKVDYMIIIGGKNSSNSQKLYDISKRSCENSVIIETYKELEIEKIKQFNKIGIMAGASTPKESIYDVVKVLGNGL